MNPEHFWNVGNRMLQAPLPELVWGLLSSSVVCAVLGIAIAFVAARVRHGGPSGAAVARVGHAAIGVIALAVGLVWIGDIALRGYVIDMSAAVSRWRFALAPVVAAAGVAAWAVTRRATQPRRAADAGSVTRRTWVTFGPRRGLVALLVAMVVAVGVMVVFGRMSTAFEPGLAAHVAMEAPNVEAPPVVTVFPGWAYGIPLLAGAVALAAAVVLALHRNAARPFPDGVRLDLERRGRADAARDIVALAVATMLLMLGGVLRLARSAAADTMTVQMPSGHLTSVQLALPHADLIMVGGIAAPMLEIAGSSLLTLLVVRAAAAVHARRRQPAPPAEVRV
ncbi:hypothetical protein FHS07_002658 [Microbacterium proteolyticum]|uniref:Uncharacterized protein n=1 Tax=Microbacterium proteolyticum TaxID=1572644 RepID=A0A7W5CKM2_9MICO|nr:hypothetical protein [Microbacterium proteolyticum]MBB3158940.1 hypothetical protein [Microbacterium proteolyticum]